MHMAPLKKKLYHVANESLVPMVVFSCIFAWFNLSQEIELRRVITNLFIYPEWFIAWIFWCSIPGTILLIFVLDNLYKKGKTIPYLFFLQLFVACSYFQFAINGSSSSRVGAQHMHVILFPILLWIILLPFLIYIFVRYFIFAKANAPISTLDSNSRITENFNQQNIMLRITVWSAIGVFFSLVFSFDPYFFRPLIQFLRYLFGL